ncbi:tRNA (adenosine(37)-N6)-dimethylallyltransferase MiaA [Flavobacterium sp. Fl-77]|uniref:tRNA dimethylallyltransferase n=1 Tax=Flavobacterium flavipigmentatum TaxID=2893884 RepID=A0AAJ2S8H1_9FLAO|nr:MULTISPECIES: tRNA (adenosine(37)-N6)-dimethylallyltransferase MiaA [unclassified Flavobacterium]MDX6181534.1 tRNA (adenosine(37)-N6)-dimethylallyltransferase MiaA [Flavobacterium sp. Fl-33]MDX6185432.1 tRNA (adenosine(37)-N6)-dimethylallyltransferase MiaA [Flavobacterium sp. Fl-77]UFH37535.1 tRNA (adenosine(37)-N6)-dimethylallyltransferase MiaA [Flavobacterium sp. F-70]
MKYLITIVGPTAIGKTALSIALANHFECEIVSCDSRQFFKEMTIGTAVPNKEELQSATHHFIQNKSILENYTVGDYEKEALNVLEELFKNNDFAVLIGGSGLYVDAILKGFDEFPEIDASIRTTVNSNYEKLGIDYLQEQLQLLDANYFQQITKENPQTLQNPQRMMRFVEVCLGTGKPYSSFLNQKKNNRNFTPILIGLEAGRAIIYERINQRVDTMLQAGLVEEAKELYPNKVLNALQTVGYRELFSYFDGEFSLPFAIEEIKKNTRRFSKRQLTWFKRNEATRWFDYTTPQSEIISYIQSKTNNLKNQ